MGNYLDGGAEIIAPALFLNHSVVDLAGGAVVAPAHPGFHESLVMPQIEVGLGTVVGDEHLAVLKRAHGARIDVDVGIHLEQGDLQAARLEQCAQGGSRESLAQR